MPDSDYFAVILSIVVLTLIVIPGVITGLKGKSGMVVAGLFFHPCWWIGAILLAKPNSWWARRFYDEGKLRRAQDRFAKVRAGRLITPTS